MKIIPIILSGGFGTRLWPLSRQKMPKQFMENVFGDETLFSKALKLVSNKDIFLPPMVVTNQEHKFFVLQEYQKLGINPENIILEPCSKNTSIAITCACIHAQNIYKDQEAKLLILSSDHLIESRELFENSILNATQVIGNKIVTFGINPSFASTGYGYIKKSQKISNDCFSIEKFTEKPDKDTAESFLSDGSYLWNGGIFLLQSNIYLEESEKYLSEQLIIATKSINSAKKDDCSYLIDFDIYNEAENISIDYGILEKSKNVAVTELISKWSDVGDFNSIYQVKPKDKDNNVIFGDVKTYDSSNSLIYSNNSLITCLGLDNIVAIETDDSILIANKDRAQDVKLIVNDLASKGCSKVKLHNRVFRPWGYYETLSEDKVFKVKRILVNPKACLSLQMHEFRSEHWVVIKGRATVQNDTKIFDLNSGESTFVPLKTKHRLFNKTEEPLEIIEVQIGSKVSEDDIIRFDDIYGRS